MDKGRRGYHKNYTGENWTDIRCYDIAVNTAKAGIDGATQTILTVVSNMP
jgi:cytidylate kinase